MSKIIADLKQIIEQRGVSLAVLADRMTAAGHKCDYAQISKWLNGHRSPRIESVEALARALELSLELEPESWSKA